VLEFDDNDVDCERDDEIVVFVRVGDVFDESDCEGVGELDVVEVGIDENVGVEIDVFDEVESEISKMSTTFEKTPIELCLPPPKTILFLDDVDASQSRG
jgi:hypothetical protein